MPAAVVQRSASLGALVTLLDPGTRCAELVLCRFISLAGTRGGIDGKQLCEALH